ncbi:MAG TPA: YgjP-like metallopeptidase domain-containing protein [Methanobacterium sp.]|nr:YgjP-like metallopeptidase domain-containing protein [Methanobacterium sp.]
MIKRVKIQDIEVEYEVIHRKVKYARLEIKTDKMRLIMPLNYNEDEEIIKKHEKWIYNKISLIKASQKEAENKELNFVRTHKEFKDMVLSSVEKFSRILGVEVNKVFFKKMKTRWGSCSSRRNVNINKYLMHLPSYLIEYVVFHEVAHLVEMGHNKRFWKIIEQKYPDYKDMEDELLLYWLLIRKLIDGEGS